MSDFGRDTSFTDSLRTGRFASGPRLVAEAAYRRLTTRRGWLRGGEEEQFYGIDISELCGNTNPKAAAASLPARIRAELEKDERIEKVDVDVLVTFEGPAASFSIEVKVATREGPFTLSLLASAVTVELLGIAA